MNVFLVAMFSKEDSSNFKKFFRFLWIFMNDYRFRNQNLSSRNEEFPRSLYHIILEVHAH